MLITPLSRYPVHRSSSGKTWTSGRLYITARPLLTGTGKQFRLSSPRIPGVNVHADTMAPDYDARVLTGCAGPGKELLW